jgi:hypothetical protein
LINQILIDCNRSVVGRTLQSTYWPSILSSDTAAGGKEGVKKRVVFMTYLSVFATLLVSIAGIASPIGLGESIVDGPLINATFAHARDSTALGEATPPRDNYTISRICASSALPCPGVSSLDLIITPNTDLSGSIYEAYVPKNITDCFMSGVESQGDLRSDPFQIQFRQYTPYSGFANTTNSTSNGVTHTIEISNTTGEFTMLESVVLLDSIDVREGVIIDTVNGGIGFRNHTVPVGPAIRYGVTWTEDILWIELVTNCVDTNWTLEISPQLAPLANSPNSAFSQMWLVNRGGGVISDGTPHFTPFDNSNPQLNPDLGGRAHLGASMFNYVLSTMLHLTAQNTSNTRYEVDSNDAVSASLQSFTLGSTGLLLGELYDVSFQGSYTSPPIVSLDPAVFNLSAFNVSQFEDYLDTVMIPVTSQIYPTGGLNFSDGREFKPCIAVRSR